MATAPVSSANVPPAMDDTAVFTAIRDYDWDNDQEFQTGLRTILATAPPESVDGRVLRAKWFFYKRKTGVTVDFEKLKHWSTQGAGREGGVSAVDSTSPPDPQAPAIPDSLAQPNHIKNEAQDGKPVDEAPYPKSFTDIVELITSGKPIPGIKEIPDVVLDNVPASVSERPERKKPWET